MMRRLSAALLSLCLAGSAVQAQAAPADTPRSVDMAQLTCAQFNETLQRNTDLITVYVMWLDGYASALGNEARLEPNWLQTLAEAVAESCVARLNAKTPVLSIVQQARDQLRTK